MATTSKSTYDKFIEKLTPEELADFQKGYVSLLVSELILAAMHEDGITVRKLAEEAGISPIVIESIRSGERGISLVSLIKIFNGLGYTLQAEKNGEIIPLTRKNNR